MLEFQILFSITIGSYFSKSIQTGRMKMKNVF